MSNMSKADRMLVEAIDGMLQQDAKLGLAYHDQSTPEAKQDWRGYQYLHEQIDDMFTLKAAELLHAESVTAAFRKVHGYKYLEDWTFLPAMDREMIAKAVPVSERRKAMEFIPQIAEELRSEQQVWAEKDAGFNPRLDEIRKLSKPKTNGKFKIHDRPINKRNVEKPKFGDGSPARTSMKQPPLPSDGHDPETDPGDGEGN
jgi:hypothetical protein